MAIRRALYGFSASAITIAATTPAQAQATATPRPEASAQAPGAGLEDIVVTARRVEESLQRTPISVSALSSRAIEQAGIQTVDKIQNVMPNVAVTESAAGIGGAVAFIRGIGSQDPSIALDVPVGTYLDGVYIARNIASNLNILDVERIEVLRGPQGTLFGRNTTGGAINIVTRKPSSQFHVEEKFGVASFGELSSRTTVDSGAIGGTGLSAMATYYHRQRNGYVDNPYAPDHLDPGALNTDAVGVKVRGEWGRFTATYAFDYNHTSGVNPAFQIRFVTPAIANYYATQTTGNPVLFSPDYQDRLGSSPYEQTIRSKGHSLNLALDLDDHITLKSISGYRRFVSNFIGSYAPPGVFGPVLGFATPQPVVPYSQDHYYEFARQYSQELQLSGKYDHLSFVGGLYYFNERTAGATTSRFTFVLPSGLAVNQVSLASYGVRSKSYAAFGQASYTPPILDGRLELTGGVRYTKDKKAAAQSAPIVRGDERSFDNLSFMLSLAYRVTDDMLLYGKYSTGYRSGGFNVRATSAGQAFFFPSEKAKAGEIGIKSEFLDRHLRINAAGFYTDYRNLQVPIYTNTSSGATGFTNPAKATFKGFDAEIEALPFRNFKLSGSVGYVDAQYQHIYFPAPGTGVITDYADIAHFPYVPKWTTNVAAEYTIPDTGVGDFTLRANMASNSRRWFFATNLSSFNPFNDKIASRAYRTVDTRLVWTKIPLPRSVEAEMSFFVENVLNTHYPVSGIDFGALGIAGNIYNIPRRFGADFRIKL